MNGELSGLDLGTMGAVAGAGLLFGIAYNALVAWLNRTGRGEGYTSFLVVGGVLVTIALSSLLIGLAHTLIIILIFICTGLPMIIGDVYRYTEARRRASAELAATLREVANDTNQTVA